MTELAKGADKQADLAGPGIGDYAELEKILPDDYASALDPRETQAAIYTVKEYIERNLCRELNLQMVQVPLIVDVESGINDMLDRDGKRGPIQFHISNDYDQHPIDAQVVQAATKWKRPALRQFGFGVGEGLCTDMRAVRKDYFLDHDHSCYVDQWDWEKVITAEDRNLEYLKATVRKIWKVLKGAEREALDRFPSSRADKHPELPEEITFIHAGGPAGALPHPAAQAARDGDPPGDPRDLHHRHRLDARRRLPARDACRRLRRLGDPDGRRGRPADARPERRHPRLEPCHPPPP